MEAIDLNRRFTKNNIHKFVQFMEALDKQIGFKVSSRGWAYIMEQKGFVTKGQFDKVENLINRCRKKGHLPVDFTAEEAARDFKEVHKPTTESAKDYVKAYVEMLDECEEWYEPYWWKNETYYIQMVVEKIDLVTLFQPICKKYHIPIANAKGWSSILQRAEYARRFKRAEEAGLECVLLYCGDHDPDGLRISETLRKNIADVSRIRWRNGEIGYDPTDLEIERFGLNYDFIVSNNLIWIDNLETGSEGQLAKMENGKIVRGTTKQGRPHPNWDLPYLQDYLKKVGVRKCEANSLVTAPEEGRQLCEDTILSYLGLDAEDRFKKVKAEVVKMVKDLKDKLDIDALTQDMLDAFEDDE